MLPTATVLYKKLIILAIVDMYTADCCDLMALQIDKNSPSYCIAIVKLGKSPSSVPDGHTVLSLQVAFKVHVDKYNIFPLLQLTICDPLPQNEAEVAALYFELWLIIDDLGRCGPIWFFCIFSYSKTLSCMLLTHLFLSDIFDVQNGHFSQVSYI